MAEQQASLRRVATLVAEGVAPADVFAAIAREVAQLLHPRLVGIFRWERDGSASVVGTWGDEPNPFPVGSNWPWHEQRAERARDGSPFRIEDLGELASAVADAGREMGIGSAAGAAIVVDGEPWGLIAVGAAHGGSLPEGIEERLADFTGLAAAAISTGAAREQLARLADEQAALRRVAMLVARGPAPAEVFDAVVEEVGRLLGVASTGLLRFEPDETVTLVAGWGRFTEEVPVGIRLPLGGLNVTSEIARTGRPARYDRGVRATGALGEHARGLNVRAAVGGPIVVAGRLWGAMTAAAVEGGPLPPNVEERLAQFAELLATAIANAESRAELRQHAKRQAALRRVATLVAQGVEADELLSAVAREIAAVAQVDGVHIYHYEPDGTAILVAVSTTLPEKMPLGTRHALGGYNIPTLVYRTGRVARMDDMTRVTGTPAAIVQRVGVRSVVGSPIVVDGGLWGVVVAATAQDDPIPADTERRINGFTELVATAIANADSRAQLAASRARVVAATTEERQRIVRDLHDGAQQRLVHASITLQFALRALEAGDGGVDALVSEALDHTKVTISELRELAHGIMPAALTRGGLRAAVAALADRSSLPVAADIGPERYPSPIEGTAYFVVSEALTNVVKHAGANRAEVIAGVQDGRLRVEVRDDGVGGADPGRGSGLAGLRDRVEALGGSIEIVSPAGGGTALSVRIPL